MSKHFDEKAGSWDQDPVRVARAAEIAARIQDRVDLPDGARVLDYGCGTGLLGFHFLARGAVTFADASPGMLREVEAKLEAGGHTAGRTVLLDPGHPELPGAFHAIVSLMTLHHVAEPREALAFLADHLEPGGWLALCDLDAEDGSFHDPPQPDVHHGFPREALARWARDVGLVEIGFTTPWVMRAQRGGVDREYPLFLLTARRGAAG